MKLSIIIPVFNQEVLLLRALDSIPRRRDIEVVVIDDGSTDKTWDNLMDYSERHKNLNIVCLCNPENKGVGYTVNKGYDFAIGEYVVLLGSDDYFYTDRLEKAMEELDGTDLIYFDLEINNGDVWKLNDESKHILGGSVKFMRRVFIGKTRCPETRYAEDLHFYRKLLAKNPTEKFLNVAIKHYNFPREGSLSYLFNKGELQGGEIMEEQTVTCEDCGNSDTIVVEDASVDNTITCPNCGGEEK